MSILATISIGTATGQAQVTVTQGGPHTPRAHVGPVTSPPAPGEVVPATGAAGTTIVIQDDLLSAVPNLANFSPVHVLLTSAGDRGYLGRCESFTVSSISGVIAEGDPFPQPENAVYEFGTGVEQTVPALGTMTYPNPVWGWRGDLNDPMNYGIYESISPFLVTADPLASPAPALMPRKIWAFFYLDINGCLRAQLPGPDACKGDRFAINLEFSMCDTNTGDVWRNALICPPSGPFVSQQDWDLVSPLIVWPLINSLNAPPSGASASYDQLTNELVICPQSGFKITGLKRKSFIVIVPDPTEYTQYTQLRGDLNLTSGDAADTATPGANFVCWATATLSAMTKEYDEVLGGNGLKDSFDNIGDTILNGFVRAAVLEIRIQGSLGASDDRIGVGYDECADILCGSGSSTVTDMTWKRDLDSLLADLGGWNSASPPTTLFINLNILPETDGTLTDIIDMFECGDLLDFIVENDTIVDFADLHVWRCP